MRRACVVRELLHVSEEVAQAVREGAPVVALESSIIAQGMPFPQNLQTAMQLEGIIRDNCAVPATIGILDGRIFVGLSEEQIELLGSSGHVSKVNKRDIAVALATKVAGATTVSATLFAAHLAGIRVVATGGLGGVHRGAEDTWDISADLSELARTPGVVVCSGTKAILDIGRTLELLETLGVPVLGFKTREFPAFYCRESGFQLEHKVDTADEVARVLAIHWRLGHPGGVLVANPIPEEHGLDKTFVEQKIKRTLNDASTHGVRGKALTPYLLQRLHELTRGVLLRANQALVRSNTALGAQIAVALAGSDEAEASAPAAAAAPGAKS
jgi:pseudouridylate synthase